MLKIEVLRNNNFWHARKIVAIIFIIPLISAIPININFAVDYHSQIQCSCPADTGRPAKFLAALSEIAKVSKNSLLSKVLYYYLVGSIVYR